MIEMNQPAFAFRFDVAAQKRIGTIHPAKQKALPGTERAYQNLGEANRVH
jgi:hypothetical protein